MRTKTRAIGESSKQGVQSFLFGHTASYYRILGIVVFLTLFGVIMVLSSSSVDAIKAGNNGFSIFAKQAAFALVGFTALFVASRLQFEKIRSLVLWFFVGAMGLQLLTVTVIGHEVNGNKNWINLGIVSIQPSEILKLAMILYLADILARNRDDLDISANWTRPFWICMGAIGLVIGGKDMGTAMVMVAVLLGVLAFAGMPRIKFYKYSAFIVVAGFIVLRLSPSRMGRIMAWLNPSAPDPLDYNWQQSHAIWAFASGGVTGVGLGNSKLKWSWIPEAENDFIFAIIGEEGGLIFALVVVVLFVLLVWFLLRAAENMTSDFSKYLTYGLLIWIGVQASINIAVVLGVLPVLGVPLPLISAGGSSLIMLLSGIGLVLGAERQNANPVSSRRTR